MFTVDLFTYWRVKLCEKKFHVICERPRDLNMKFSYNRVCAPDVIKTKEPLKVLSSSDIRGTKFIPVYNFPAQ